MVIYREKVVRIESTDPEVMLFGEDLRCSLTTNGIALVKQYVLRGEKQFAKVQREIAAFENIEKLDGATREAIPDSVRLFVWQRDEGKCVKCSSNQKLEFDHIIPVVKGGSNTERNIQLLCEGCNRSKGASL